MARWMRQRDLQQALLRGASINDTGFSTLVQALSALNKVPLGLESGANHAFAHNHRFNGTEPT